MSFDMCSGILLPRKTINEMIMINVHVAKYTISKKDM